MQVYWLQQREEGVPSGDAWLSGGELALLAGLRFPKRRADWRLGRWTAKCAIAARLRLAQEPVALAAIEIRPASTGAPEAFVGGRPADLSLSLSHSNGVGFCAVGDAGADLGCDVEKVTPHSEAFLADYFTAAERDLVAECRAMDPDTAMTLLWSAKESALKALRCGLRDDTRSVTVTPAEFPPADGGEWSGLTARHSGGRTFHGWWRPTADLVWTVMADSAALPPVGLSIAG